MNKRVFSKHTKALALICLVFLCIHTGLFLFDLAHPDAFLHGDRAHGRINTIMGLLEAAPAEFPDLVLKSSSGVPGDFLQHALLYWIGGPYLVIACQIALQLLTLVMTYIATVRLGGNAAVAIAAGLFLVVMPGTLMNPHLLTSETWFVAFLTAGVLLICQSVDPAKQILLAHYYFPGVVSLALASSVRPQGLLVPFAAAVCLCIWIRRDYGKIVAGGLLSYLIFPIALMTLRFFVVGEFSIGLSDSSLESNFAIRADRILSLPIGTNEKMAPLVFLQIAADHPWAAVNSYYSDAINLIFNPGINHVITYYLGLFPDGLLGAHWGDIRDQSGFLGMATELLRQSPVFIALFAIWTIVHFMILYFTIVVAFRALLDGRQTPMWVYICLVVTFSIFASAFAAGQLRWDHRAGIEPLLALLAAYGLFGQKTTAFSRLAFAPSLRPR